MALGKTTEEQFEVHPTGVVHVRTATIVTDDGVEIARNFHRHLCSPGDDISGESPECQAICEAVWTEEKVKNFEASQPDEEI